jgi:hypothetical protein
MAQRRKDPNVDLIVAFTELRTEFRSFTEEMRRYIETNSGKIAYLENMKADRTELIEATGKQADHETRLRIIESDRWKIYAIASAIALIVEWVSRFIPH